MGYLRIIRKTSMTGLHEGPLTMMEVPPHERSPDYVEPSRVPEPSSGRLIISPGLLNDLDGFEPSLSALAFSVLLGRLQNARRLLLDLTTNTTNTQAPSNSFPNNDMSLRNIVEQTPSNQNNHDLVDSVRRRAISDSVHNQRRTNESGTNTAPSGNASEQDRQEDLSDRISQLIVMETPFQMIFHTQTYGDNDDDEQQVNNHDGNGDDDGLRNEEHFYERVMSDQDDNDFR